MINLLIADDHLIVREGLKEIIKQSSDIIVIDEASNGVEVLHKLDTRDYDIVLLDISLPRKNGIEVLSEIKKKGKKVNFLVLSIYPEEMYALRCFKEGAGGYLTKECPPEELLFAIRTVSQGRKYLTRSLAQKLGSSLEFNFQKPLHESLSTREFQVMIMIASGKHNKRIAKELSLSVKTISTYRSRILKKMKMENNSDIIYYCITNGLTKQ